MLFSQIDSAYYRGVSVYPVHIEADVTRGLNSFSVVGLGDRAVQEARDRVASAIKNTGYRSPKHFNYKTVISLSPAYEKKTGTQYDIGIALAYLVATGQISALPESAIAFGELSLDGALRSCGGIVALVLYALSRGFKHIIISKDAREVQHIPSGDCTIHVVSTLADVVACLDTIDTCGHRPHVPSGTSDNALLSPNFDDIVGHDAAKRALEIAVAGGHHCMLSGPPGAGKTLLAKAALACMPALSEQQRLEVAQMYSLYGQESASCISVLQHGRPPFRSPHHSASLSAMIGSASGTLGELSLAHHGILFLDECIEFNSRVIESLRIPLEEYAVTVSRADQRLVFPARFLLIAAMNPETTNTATRHQKKLSPAIQDRFDIWIAVEPIPTEKLVSNSSSNNNSLENEHAALIRHRCAQAQLLQCAVHGALSAHLSAAQVTALLSKAPQEVQTVCTQLAAKYALSSRGVHKIIKVAHTIASLDGRTDIGVADVLEAARLRCPSEPNG